MSSPADKRTPEEAEEEVNVIIGTMLELTPEQRLTIIAEFCTSCGADDPRCQCWNDE